MHHWAHTWIEEGQRFGARTNIGKNVVLGAKLLEGRKDEISGWMTEKLANATAKIAGSESKWGPDEEKEASV